MENLVLAQQAVDQKSNQITAVPELPEMLDWKGAVVRGDAMNTQKQIAARILAFNEDQSRIRKDHGDQNLAVLHRIALGLLRRDKSVKLGAKNKRLKASRNRDYLLRVLLLPVAAK